MRNILMESIPYVKLKCHHKEVKKNSHIIEYQLLVYKIINKRLTLYLKVVSSNK